MPAHVHRQPDGAELACACSDVSDALEVALRDRRRRELAEARLAAFRENDLVAAEALRSEVAKVKFFRRNIEQWIAQPEAPTREQMREAAQESVLVGLHPPRLRGPRRKYGL